ITTSVMLGLRRDRGRSQSRENIESRKCQIARIVDFCPTQIPCTGNSNPDAFIGELLHGDIKELALVASSNQLVNLGKQPLLHARTKTGYANVGAAEFGVRDSLAHTNYPVF